MRFEISKVLDAIEGRVCTDPSLARAVLDLAEVIRYQDIDGGRPASLLRLGMVIDALARRLRRTRPVSRCAPALLSDARPHPNAHGVRRGPTTAGRGARQPRDRVEVADLLGLPC